MICFRISAYIIILIIVANSFAENVTEPHEIGEKEIIAPIAKPITAGRFFRTIGVALGVTMGVTILFPLAVCFLLYCAGFGINGILIIFSFFI